MALQGPQKPDVHVPPPNEELLSDVPLALGCSYSLLQRSLVTAQTCSLEHVHVCVRPRNLRRGCGGKAPKKRLMPLIFTRLCIRSWPRSIRSFFKLGDSNSGLKLSIHVAHQGLNLRDLARSCQFNPMTVKVMNSPATPFFRLVEPNSLGTDPRPPLTHSNPLEPRYDQPVHVCVRPRNLRRGCGGKAPKNGSRH